MSQLSYNDLLDAGVHFGHLTRKWNPAMAPYIFMEKNGIHIIDLNKTVRLAEDAGKAARQLARSGRKILFVATKKQAKEIIRMEAERVNMPYVTERWLGGMLTNFTTIRKSIKRLTTIDKMEVDGTFEKITKKERLMLGRERDRLRKVFGGIEDMTRIPGLIIVVDIKKEHLAIKEAKTLGIPVIGIVDTNSDPSQVDYPIPANDDSIKAIELILGVLSGAIGEGRDIARAKAADLAAAGEAVAKENEGDDTKVRRQLRTRKAGGKGEGSEQ
jgi:small subunit ribosomal protein S2